MNHVLKGLLRYRFYMVIAWLLMLIELAVELMLPLFLGTIVDKGILPQDFHAVLYWGLLLVGLTFLSFLAGIGNTFFAAKVSQSFAYDVRNRIFQKIQRLSFAQLNRYPTSTLITRLTNDVQQIQATVFMIMRVFLRAPLMIIFGTVMAITVHAKLSLILIFIIPVSLLFLFWMMKKGIEFFRWVQTSLDQMNRMVRENLAAIRLIRAFNRGKDESERFTNINQRLQQHTERALRFAELTAPTLLLLMNSCIVLILWFGNIQLTVGGAEAGEVVAIINYGMRITNSLSILSWIIMSLSRSKASLDRLNEILSIKEEEKPAAYNGKHGMIRGELRFHDVTFSYKPGRPVLKHINFHIGAGQTVAIIGTTGSGKTSLFQLIPRLFQPDSGEIFLDGKDIRTFPLETLRQAVGYVSQDAYLFTGTIKENIAWGDPDADFATIVQAAKDAQIHDTILRFPDGYDTVIGQKGVNLSGGQKQRLAIARALVRRPKILLLDSATSALDVRTEEKLLEALTNYDCTILMITQKISTAQKADIILLMDDGEIIARGTHEELLHSSPVYRKIHASQKERGDLDHVYATGFAPTETDV